MNSYKVIFICILFTLVSLCFANKAANDASKQGTGAAITASGILSAISSMVPGMMSNVIPMALLFGLGALMVPALGLGLLLREGRRSDYQLYYRSLPSFKINTSALMDGAADVLERVMKALDNAEKQA